MSADTPLNTAPPFQSASDLPILWKDEREEQIVLPPLSTCSSPVPPASPTSLHALNQQLNHIKQHSSQHIQQLKQQQINEHKTRKERTEMIKYLEAEVRRKDLMTKRLQHELSDMMQSHDLDLSTLLKTHEMSERYMEKIFMEKEKNWLDKNENLTQQISNLSHLSTLRSQLASELLLTKQTIFQTERNHMLELDALEKRFLEARDKLQMEATNKILESRTRFKQEVNDELEYESMVVRQNNDELNNALVLHETTSNRLQKENNERRKQVKDMKINNDLYYEKLQQYQVKRQQQQDSITQLTNDTKTAETQLMNALQKHETHKNNIIQQHQEKIQPLMEEKIQLQEKIKGVMLENKKLRRISSKKLKVRSEMEKFFLDAIQHTKTLIEQHAAIQHRENKLLQSANLRELTLPPSMRTKHHLPALTNPSSSPPHTASQQQAIISANTTLTTDLPLNDRMKMLRFLYSKIKHLPNSNEMKFPSHSFTIEVLPTVKSKPQLYSKSRTNSFHQFNSHDYNIQAIAASINASNTSSSSTIASQSPSTSQTHSNSSLPQLLPSADNHAQQQNAGAAIGYDDTFLTNYQMEQDEEEELQRQLQYQFEQHQQQQQPYDPYDEENKEELL